MEISHVVRRRDPLFLCAVVCISEHHRPKSNTREESDDVEILVLHLSESRQFDSDSLLAFKIPSLIIDKAT